MRQIDRQYLGVVPRHGAGSHRFSQPLRGQPFGELTLRILIVEDRPAHACIQRALELLALHLNPGSIGRSACQPPVQPQPGSNRQRAARTLAVQSQQEMCRMNQVRPLAQQPLLLPQHIAGQPDVALFEDAQTAH